MLEPCSRVAAVGGRVVQRMPHSREGTTLASAVASTPVSVSVGSLVMPSLLEAPLSCASVTPGAAGFTVSSVKVMVAGAEDLKGVVEGKTVALGGRRIIKKNNGALVLQRVAVLRETAT